MTIQPEYAMRELILRSRARARVGIRCFPQRAPQNAPRPYVVYRRIVGNPERHMGGPAALADATIQVDSYANSYDEAKALADDVRCGLDGVRGPVRVGLEIFEARSFALTSDTEDVIEPQAGSDVAIHVITQDWRVRYVLPIPANT